MHDEDSMGKVSLAGLSYFLGDGDRRRLLAGIRRRPACSSLPARKRSTRASSGVTPSSVLRISMTPYATMFLPEISIYTQAIP